MEANVTPLLRFLQGPKQFFIPIFQRRYSWEERHCSQLWEDILRVGENDEIKSHFLGSIVYMEPGPQLVAAVRQLLVIDGQQRLTTLSLLLSALSRVIDEEGSEIGISPRRLSNYYIFNPEEDDEFRYKQLLTRRDKETLIHLLEDRELPTDASPLLVDNYRFFETKLRDADLQAVYDGIQKLRIVGIMLDRKQDNPQLIFESLNSTGLSLSQADLIRNYVLMGQEPDFQKKLYGQYWFPMEQLFGDHYTKRFDRFIRDYLTLETRRIPNIKSVYEKFKVYLPTTGDPEELEMVVENIARYAKHYVNIALLQEEDQELRACFEDIQDLQAETTFSFLLEVYEHYEHGEIDKTDIIKITRLVESYVFRRAVCGIPSNVVSRIFAPLITKVDRDNYLESLKDAFSQMPHAARYPKDHEFKQALLTKDVYHFNKCNYLLRKLENYNRREPVSVENFRIEHVMPQNSDLSEAWRSELGENFRETQEEYLHTIGNLTLTRYNPKLSDRSFREKQVMEGGFRDSPLSLNWRLARAAQWNQEAILGRAEELTEKALKIWISSE